MELNPTWTSCIVNSLLTRSYFSNAPKWFTVYLMTPLLGGFRAIGSTAGPSGRGGAGVGLVGGTIQQKGIGTRKQRPEHPEKKHCGRILPWYFGKWGNESVAAGLMNFAICVATEWFMEDRSTSTNCNVMSRGRSGNSSFFSGKINLILALEQRDDFHKLDKQQQVHHIPSKKSHQSVWPSTRTHTTSRFAYLDLETPFPFRFFIWPIDSDQLDPINGGV